MKIPGAEMSQAQIEAGLSVMRGEFAGTKVMTALDAAGVLNCVSGAEILIAREIKLGRIERVTRGLYRQA